MSAAPFGTIAEADAKRNAVLPVTMTPAQRRVARAILGFDRGQAMRSSVIYVDDYLVALVAQELVEAGLATSERYREGATTFRLSREAAVAALEPGEVLSFRAYPPPGVIAGDI